MNSEIDSLSYVNIDINLFWQQSDDTSDSENSVFVSIPSYTEESKVIIENADRKIVLQFNKTGSTFRLKDDLFWYNKKNLISVRKL
jgi:hypothetical protein